MSKAGDIEKRSRESDKIVSFFTERIMLGRMRPGEKLPSEAGLCRQFGTSRTVVREAIQQMKARGMVDTINGRGSFIAEGSMDHFQASLQLYSSHANEVQDWLDLLSMRTLIELECVRELVETGSAEALGELEAALDEMRQASDDLGRFAEADIAFHEVIVRASSNRLLIAVWASLRKMSLRFALDTYRSLGQVPDNLADHEAILAAVVNRRVEEATGAMKEHLAHSRANLARLNAAE